MRHLLYWAASAVVCITGWAQTPVTVINYSGFDTHAPVAAGSIASAYGDFGNIQTTAWSANVPEMPRELATVKIKLNGTEAPLYFVSNSQINFTVPVGTPAGQQSVEVLVGTNVVAKGTVNIYDFFPALAARTTDATRPGVILNEDNSDNLSVPAARGSVIQLFATGCGATTPAAVDGIPPGTVAPTVARVQAYISWDEAEVLYAGLQPQFPGVCQVNIRIPDKAYIAGDVPLFIKTNGLASNPVSVRVQ